MFFFYSPHFPLLCSTFPVSSSRSVCLGLYLSLSLFLYLIFLVSPSFFSFPSFILFPILSHHLLCLRAPISPPSVETKKGKKRRKIKERKKVLGKKFLLRSAFQNLSPFLWNQKNLREVRSERENERERGRWCASVYFVLNFTSGILFTKFKL